MRRSQTTILTTLAVIASLLFMSQFPAVSNVANVHPDQTDGTPPPNTDTDGDLIPDVHETLFEEWMNWTAVDGREVVLQGLDKNNASDASTDRDRDGLNATEEFCWPYPANCTAPGFPRGLTGQLDENSDRIYLDPRVSDTDGDGMPDGYEAYMCHRLGGFDPVALRYACPSFDPLNASDLTLDGDNDGFDVDRDGILSDAERFTAPEEYAHGTPANFTAELDGLWCYATLPEGAMLKNWPFLPSGANATFHNLLPACTSRAVNPVGEDLWLGTDPLLDDSDRYLWDGFSVRPLYPSFGDGIPDGWEVHFGLDPLNRSNALDDPDNDGWDTNRDGGISSDVSRTLTALKVGEALSTLEEYLVHYDDGNTVYPGLKTTFVGDETGFSTLPLVYDAPEETLAVMHHDVRALEENDGVLYAMTKYGVSVLNLDASAQSHHSLPQGVVLHDGFLATSDGSPYAVVMGTSIGFAVAPLLADGALGTVGTWSWSMGEPLHAVAPLAVRTSTSTPSVWVRQGKAASSKLTEVPPSFPRTCSVPVSWRVSARPTHRSRPSNTVSLAGRRSISSSEPTVVCSSWTPPPRATTPPVRGGFSTRPMTVPSRPTLTNFAACRWDQTTTPLKFETWCSMALHRPTLKPFGLERRPGCTNWI